jgi:hypothetical protein
LSRVKVRKRREHLADGYGRIDRTVMNDNHDCRQEGWRRRRRNKKEKGKEKREKRKKKKQNRKEQRPWWLGAASLSSFPSTSSSAPERVNESSILEQPDHHNSFLLGHLVVITIIQHPLSV